MDSQATVNITDLIIKCNDYLKEAETIEKEILTIESAIACCKKIIDSQNLAFLILGKASSSVRGIAKTKIEDIVTNALQFVTQDSSIKFIIEESITRSKPSYEFLIETNINGNLCRQKPIDACGGGFVDIISVTLQYAYCEIFDAPAIHNLSWLVDEPGKMISEEMSIKFAEYIKFLGKQFNRQTIMVTHKDTIVNVADKVYLVSKNVKGVSQVLDYSTLQLHQGVTQVLENLEDLINGE